MVGIGLREKLLDSRPLPSGVLKAGELSAYPRLRGPLAVLGGERLRDPTRNTVVKPQAESHLSLNG